MQKKAKGFEIMTIVMGMHDLIEESRGLALGLQRAVLEELRRPRALKDSMTKGEELCSSRNAMRTPWNILVEARIFFYGHSKRLRVAISFTIRSSTEKCSR